MVEGMIKIGKIVWAAIHSDDYILFSPENALIGETKEHVENELKSWDMLDLPDYKIKRIKVELIDDD